MPSRELRVRCLLELHCPELHSRRDAAAARMTQLPDQTLAMLRCPQRSFDAPRGRAGAGRPAERGDRRSIGCGTKRARRVERPIDGGLVREAGDLVYPIVDQIPVMLVRRSDSARTARRSVRPRRCRKPFSRRSSTRRSRPRSSTRTTVPGVSRRRAASADARAGDPEEGNRVARRPRGRRCRADRTHLTW